MKYREPARDLDVYGEFDVIVVGGGCAGFTAAVASARNGASTLIVERFPYFGGTATASVMANINGFRNQREPDGLQTTKGIGEEVILRLKELGGLGDPTGAMGPYPHKRYADTKDNLGYCYPIDTERFKYVTLKMVHESGARILFHTVFSAAIADGGTVKGIIFVNKSGRQAAFARVVVDATGDGDVAFDAGATSWEPEVELPNRLAETLMYKIAGYARDRARPLPGCECTANDTMVMWGPGVPSLGVTDGDTLTAAEIETRLAVYDSFEKLKAFWGDDLKDAHIVETATALGRRQSRFIKGLYQLTGEDVIEGRRFDDVVAIGCNPIIRYYGRRRYLEHEGYDIPYRCLLPADIDNLIVVGRCISTDQRAYETARSMACVMAVGEAGGTAAALAALSGVGPKQLDAKLLQDRLIAQGAEIGQNRSKAARG